MLVLDPALADLASAQGGVFSSRQAATLGVSRLDLHRLVARGVVRRVRRGAYVLPHALEGLTGEQRYALETRAVLLSRSDHSWASHHAALAVSGLPVVGMPTDTYDLCARVKRESRSGTVITHPLPPREACLLVEGIPSVSTETAIVQTAVRHGVRGAVVAGDAALSRGLVSRDTIANAVERLELGVRASQRVDRLLELVDASAESAGESLTRLLLTGLGLSFETQVEVRDAQGFIGRVDFLVERRVVVEFDGLVKYEGADGRAALAKEKAREDRLRAAGYEIVRLVWADLQHPDRIAMMLRQARSRAASRR